MYDLHCWEYGVLQLVSEQVSLSGQVVESKSSVMSKSAEDVKKIIDSMAINDK